ncbi:MarR family transcriptional regulator [Curtobacterium sp. MCPF17_050]|uniref:MarR family winged helix-turn-helix transcriptional regulator n=1 Tax=Curtobacterium sp. MCPF17_050 TaxID=2175664 RepID=UPI000D8C44FA|nr:MarR family transcriptional regulator [Curtobacterium sp. MCPF17_050]WIB16027.1 MarR family transcriptional regulator [Curtobacterium sp. MCPF17_050]
MRTHRGGPHELLTREEREAWLAILALTLKLPAALDATLRETGDVLLVEFIVLSYLAEDPGSSRRMSAIAKESHLSPSRTTHLVGRLEKRGLVTRHPSDDDGRAIVATLTAEGSALVRELSPVHAEDARARVFNKLSTEQIDALRDIARTITDS